jgi:hypothetical protein
MVQYPYPEQDWAVGKMRKRGDQSAKAGPRSGDPGKEFRELEGIRKRKEQILSGGGQQYAQMGREIVSDADVGTAAGTILGPGSQAISTMERLSLSQRNAQGQFDTILSSAEETAFQAWKKKHAPNDSGQDYDLRGAFKQGFKPDEKGHWPDMFKKPNHPTFSDQSVYAKEVPERAGKWEGETYIPPGGG